MTAREFEALPPDVAEWMERLYIAADGQPQKSASLETVLQEGEAEEVVRCYTLETDMKKFYGGKV